MNELLDALQCPECHGENFSIVDTGFQCAGCSTPFPVRHGVTNALGKISSDVARELKGMIEEQNAECPELNDFLVRKVGKVSRFEDRKKYSATLAFDYDGSTEMHFHQALSHIQLSGNEKVLEVGAQDDFPFLSVFRDKGCACFATNIFFNVDDDPQFRNWPHKVLGDMNRLPYRDGYFDVVLASATTHHSPSLETTIREFARVTKPGGTILIINEPTRALLKHAWDWVDARFRIGGGRHTLIHENEYSVAHYRRLFRRNGLAVIASLFPDYYDARLKSGRVRGVRFAPLARLASGLWRVPPFRWSVKRFGLRPLQATLGFQLNIVVRKMRENRLGGWVPFH